MAAKRKRGGSKGKLPLRPGTALLAGLAVEAVSLAILWLIVGNLAALGLVARAQLWEPLAALAAAAIGWVCYRRLGGSAAGGGWTVLAGLLFVALAWIELQLLGSGFIGSFSISAGG
jgi:hypothetical protein